MEKQEIPRAQVATHIRQRLFDEILNADRAALQMRRHVLHRLDLTTAQGEILILLQDTSHSSDIARQLHISNSAVTQLVESLEEKNYVTRTRSEHDKRVVSINLTRHGKRQLKRALKMKCALAESILSHLSDTEIQQLYSIHTKVPVQLSSTYISKKVVAIHNRMLYDYN